VKLFAIYIGGEVAGGNIEVHDMRFIAAPSLTDTYSELKRQWWGIPKTLHIDCWAELDHADGHDITLRPEPSRANQKLYYVNVGGYDKARFLEQHQNVFVVATSVAEAKGRAMKYAKGWDALHRDDLYEAEQVFSLDRSIAESRLHIHLTPTALERQFTFSCAYTPLR
jgi:hypothetical protein